ncbi:DUF1571 domain-containing protein [Paraburkholderia sartisoli]|uniref:DUF1571 domain-containing protein n=1 Tax=Paraburkholderia sartisoli TaxID=83784 RepID=A0A1H4EF05_9BURK|nr:DUF1571 domain-containing protein [Paraburkholderia sartisoli]SEA83546.1 Protein of unknown function [Paraburkholderia sartisoli]
MTYPEYRPTRTVLDAGFARRRIRLAACGVLVCAGVVAGAARAQGGTPPPSSVGATASAISPAQVGRLSVDQQVRWLRRASQSGALEQLDDAQLLALFQSLDSQTVPRYVKEGPNGYPSYEFTMARQERIRGVWPDTPDHMLVRRSREPLRIYAKWLPDGAHAGQEVIYDESKRSDEMYGHPGGILRAVSLWTPLNGAFARAQSNHQVRDLGTEYIAQQFVVEARKFAEAGITRPNRIEVETLDGVRVVAFTYEAPSGQPAFYAKKETLGLDLRHPWFRSAESYDNEGRIFEKIVFETVTPKTFDDATFDPKNPDYRF